MGVNAFQCEYFLQHKNEQTHIWPGEADSSSNLRGSRIKKKEAGDDARMNQEWKGTSIRCLHSYIASIRSYLGSLGKFNWLQLHFFPVGESSVSVSREAGTLVKGTQHSHGDKKFGYWQRTGELAVTLSAPEVFEISINIHWPHPRLTSQFCGLNPGFDSWHFWLPAVTHEVSSLLSLNFIS